MTKEPQKVCTFCMEIAGMYESIALRNSKNEWVEAVACPQCLIRLPQGVHILTTTGITVNYL